MEPDAKITEAVLLYVNTVSWENKKRAVETRQKELFTEEADQVFVQMLNHYSDDNDAIKQLEEYRELLSRCRREGIDVAFLGYIKSPISQKVADTVIAFMNTPDWGKVKKMVEEQYDVLLSDEADQVFSLLLQRHRNEPELLKALQDRRALLYRCRREGIDPAFADRIVYMTSSTWEDVQAYVDAPTWADAKVVVQNRLDELLSDEADRLFRFLLVSAQEGKEQKVERSEIMFDLLRARMEVLSRIRTEGIDAAFADYLSPSSVIDSVNRSVDSFINSENWEDAAQIVDKNSNELLSDAAVRDIDRNILHYQGNEDACLLLELRRLFLIASRKDGSKFALELIKKVGNLVEEALSLNTLTDMPHKIEIFKEILNLIERNQAPGLWRICKQSLARCYAQDPIGDKGDYIERAIEHYNQALEVTSSKLNPILWAHIHSDIGIAYGQRILGDRSGNIERAILHFRLALSVITRESDPNGWAMIQNNLGESYRRRIQGSRIDNIEQSIQCLKAGLNLITSEILPSLWADLHINLGNAYQARIKGDRADNQEQSIIHYHNALSVYGRDVSPYMWANIHYDLSLALITRIGGDRDSNLDMAISHIKSALEIFMQDKFPLEYARAHNGLGCAFTDRSVGNKSENQENAITNFNSALQVCTRTANPELWAMNHQDLAMVYMERIEGKRTENMKHSIEHSQLALTAYTYESYPERWSGVQHNLGFTYSSLYREEHCKNDLEEAINHLKQAISVRTLYQFPYERHKSFGILGHLYFSERRWKDALTAYNEMIEAGNFLFNTSYTETGHREVIKTTLQAYINSAYSMVKLGKYSDAIVRLEQGQTRILSQTLALNDVMFANLPQERREVVNSTRYRIQELRAEMRLPISRPDRRSDGELGQELNIAYADLEYLIQFYEHSDWVQSDIDLSGILTLVPPDGVIIIPMVTLHGSVVFVLPHGLMSVTDDNVIMLDKFNSNTLGSILISANDNSGWINGYMNWLNGGQFEEWLSTIENMTSLLWDSLLLHIYLRLQSLGVRQNAHLIFINSGALGLLPIHTTWREVNGIKRFLSDDYMISYSPSAYVLRISQRRIQDPLRLSHSLMAIVDPTTDLPFSSIEGQIVAKLFSINKQLVLQGNEASIDKTIALAKNYSYLHFACHGFYDWDEVTNSALVLADGKLLNLHDILSPKFNLQKARLVTLSACETGLTEFLQLPSEYIGLPAALLEAGAPAVISSLWAVNDMSTAIMMSEFYRRHLIEGQDIVVALHGAQLYLRNATAAEMNLFELYQRQYLTSGRKDIKALSEMRYFQSNPNIKPFTNQYYWGPFFLSGT